MNKQKGCRPSRWGTLAFLVSCVSGPALAQTNSDGSTALSLISVGANDVYGTDLMYDEFDYLHGIQDVLSTFNPATVQSMLSGLSNNLKGTLETTTDPDSDKPGDPDCQTSMPVDVATGNKVKEEVDFLSRGEFALQLTRYYNKAWNGSGIFGRKWISSFDFKLGFEYGSRNCTREPGQPRACEFPNEPITKVVAWRQDGSGYSFTFNSQRGRWEDSKASPIAWLEQQQAGNWVLHSEHHTTETYNSDGIVQSVVNDYGVGWTFEYDDPYMLKAVRHSSGRAVVFTWEAGRIKTVTDPAGSVFTYGYTSYYRYDPVTATGPLASYLTAVTYPGTPAVTRTYSYDTYGANGDITREGLLGISVNGVRYTDYAYDGAKVRYSGFVDGSERTSFAYGADWTELTNAKGAKARYDFTTIASTGARKVVKISRSGVSNCASAVSDITYDANGFVDQERDWNRNLTDSDYNPKGQLVQKILAKGTPQQRTTIIEWDEVENRIKKSTLYGPNDEPVNETVFTYYPANHAAKNRSETVSVKSLTPHQSLGEVRTTTYTYSIRANGLPEIITVDGPAPGDSDKLAYRYNIKGDLLSVRNAADFGSTFSDSYNGLGLPTSVTDENGLTTSFVYDARGRTTTLQSTTGAATRTTTYTFDALGKITKTQFPDGLVVTNTYDGVGRLIRIAAGANAQAFTYDPLGEMASHKLIRRETKNPGAACSGTNSTYGGLYEDIKDSPRDISPPELAEPSPLVSEALSYLPILVLPTAGEVEELTHVVPYLPIDTDLVDLDDTAAGTYVPPECRGGMERIVDVVYFSRTWLRDELGRPLSVSGNNGQTISYRYDGNGNVHTVTDGLNRTTIYAYTPHNELSSVQDPLGRIANYSYDSQGLLRAVVDPRGVNTETTYSHDGFGDLHVLSSRDTGTTVFTYSGTRRETTQPASGPIITYGYGDPLGRLKTMQAGSDTQTLIYDTCSYGLGRLCTAQDPSGTVNYAYNGFGLLERQASVLTGAPQRYDVSWVYDAMDRVQTVTYPDGTQAKYKYNALGETLGVDAVIGGLTKPVVGAITYYPFGPRSAMNYGNGLVRAEWHDTDYRRTKIYTANIQDLVYSYNTNDEMFRITNYRDSSLTQTFGFELSRLTSVAAVAGNHSWTFDGNGNRESHTWGGAVDDYEPEDFSNRLLSISGPRARSFEYFLNGNLRTDSSALRGNYIYEYDNFNRLKSVAKASVTTTYLNNFLNQRVRKSGDGGRTYFINGPDGSLLGETIANGSAFGSWYIWLGGEPIGLIRPIDGTQTLFYVHNDHLGRPEIVTNAGKSKVWTSLSQTYDRQMASSSIGAFNLGFPGQYYDAESGLYYNWNRYYDPSTGRYLQSDPIGLAGGLNTYSYALSNPTTFIDPMGLEWQYSIISGQLSYVDYLTGNVETVDRGYSGHGIGRNHFALVSIPYVGAIPAGEWTIGALHPNVTKNSLRLTPKAGTDTYARSSFLIHGDLRRRKGPMTNAGAMEGSNGCPIFGESTRIRIGTSGDNSLTVVY
jgi:RHS repeat-associated protein